jgi:hypothetical protein
MNPAQLIENRSVLLIFRDCLKLANRMVDSPVKALAVRQLIRREFDKNREVIDQEEIRNLKMAYSSSYVEQPGPSPTTSSSQSRTSSSSRRTRPSTTPKRRKATKPASARTDRDLINPAITFSSHYHRAYAYENDLIEMKKDPSLETGFVEIHQRELPMSVRS